MTEDTYREHLNDLQVEIEELRAKLKATQTGDTISRQALNDMLDMIPIRGMKQEDDNLHALVSLAQVFNVIEQLPSAQPETHEERPETHACDCISRQAAIDLVRNCSVKEVTPAYVLIDKAEVMTGLMLLPSAQPEIIRCKDCKYYVIHTLFGRSQGWCERLCDEFDKSLARGVEPDDYCSRAERREE